MAQSAVRLSSRFWLRDSVRLCSPGLPRANTTWFRQAHATGGKEADKNGSKPARRPRNHDIPFRVVRLVNRETGQLDPPSALSDLIAGLQSKKEWIELVSENPEPVVKIIKGSEIYNKLKAQQQKRKITKREEKEIQLTWGISMGDLRHKLQKAREELERGSRVNLVYASKKGQSQLTRPEMETRLQQTVDLLPDVGKEWQPRVITKTAAVLYLQGHNHPAPSSRQAQSSRQQDARTTEDNGGPSQ